MVYDGSRETVGVTAGSLDDGPTERVLTERVMGEKGVAICEGEGMEWGDVKVLVRLGRMEGNPQ